MHWTPGFQGIRLITPGTDGVAVKDIKDQPGQLILPGKGNPSHALIRLQAGDSDSFQFFASLLISLQSQACFAVCLLFFQNSLPIGTTWFGSHSACKKFLLNRLQPSLA